MYISKLHTYIHTYIHTYGTAQRQLDTRTRSTGRTPAVKISSARYVHAGTRKGLPVTSIAIVSNVRVYCLFTRARV